MLTEQLGDCYLYKEEAEAMETAGAIRKLIVGTRGDLLAWRQSFGVWDEKTKRAANRGLLKVPKFTSKPDTFTIFELEKSSSFTNICRHVSKRGKFVYLERHRLPLGLSPQAIGRTADPPSTRLPNMTCGAEFGFQLPRLGLPQY
jgi:hypothetical protein